MPDWSDSQGRVRVAAVHSVSDVVNRCPGLIALHTASSQSTQWPLGSGTYALVGEVPEQRFERILAVDVAIRPEPLDLDTAIDHELDLPLLTGDVDLDADRL